jgi:hypothetical protein
MPPWLNHRAMVITLFSALSRMMMFCENRPPSPGFNRVMKKVSLVGETPESR